jgi:pre-mRNA-processing factor 6
MQLNSEEKRNEELERVDKRAHGELLTRKQWKLRDLRRGGPLPCEATVSATVPMGVEKEDRLAIWLGGTEAAEAHGRVGTARAVLAFALRVFPDRWDLWRRAAELEKAHGTYKNLDKLLAHAVECCPHAEVLWAYVGQGEAAGWERTLRGVRCLNAHSWNFVRKANRSGSGWRLSAHQ